MPGLNNRILMGCEGGDLVCVCDGVEKRELGVEWKCWKVGSVSKCTRELEGIKS